MKELKDNMLTRIGTALIADVESGEGIESQADPHSSRQAGITPVESGEGIERRRIVL